MTTDPAGIFYCLFAIKEHIIYLFFFFRGSQDFRESEDFRGEYTLIVEDAIFDCYGRISYIESKGADVSESRPGPGP